MPASFRLPTKSSQCFNRSSRSLSVNLAVIPHGTTITYTMAAITTNSSKEMSASQPEHKQHEEEAPGLGHLHAPSSTLQWFVWSDPMNSGKQAPVHPGHDAYPITQSLHHTAEQKFLFTVAGCSKPMSNIFEKFCPRWCDVAPYHISLFMQVMWRCVITIPEFLCHCQECMPLQLS